ncbi:PREDICTED: TMV resistance protein N-like isoform X2 [Tarenaya hassleriana]|uniref:TMV resistance protein N-like isoform X2 n=1 Tax=Tarenaya hassleriana TaxID=28532 RepID=UPI00053C6DF8|nr:PREDICTED: TMV resistance protein N-like isoform X2 [Tarenaya hassleriana]
MGSRLEWDVFLSFRGEDTRHTITARIYDALKEQVSVFRDNDALRRGDEIAPSLVEAIEDSATSVVVFSRRYADSHWCLEELAKLCDLRSSLGRPMLPIFYEVDPSHIRKQNGHFAKDFEEHEKRFDVEKVQRWRKAMNLVGNIAGFMYKNDSEDDIIERVVKRVLAELSNTPEKVGEYTVGLEPRLGKLMKLLDMESNSDVQVLGLYGMGGIGKSTLAKALYNKIVGNFKHRVFLSNVRERSSEQDGMISLQKILVNELFHGIPQIDDVNSGKDLIKERVHDKKILVVLDDVDHVNQVASLIGERRWHGEGSVLVITTREENILSLFNVDRHYEVSCLDESEALKLFSYHALRKEKPTDRLLQLSKDIVSWTGHLPLALEVFGSLLYDKREEREWRALLEKLKNIQPKNLQDVLAVSYHTLDNEEQCVFLDIACLFIRMEITKEDIIDILKGCGFNAEAALNVLKQKSLVKIMEDDTLWMHDQIRDMGRTIVLNENITNPGMRSRLWNRAEIMTVLRKREGTRSIHGIVFDFKKKFVRDPSADEIALRKLQAKPNICSVFDYLRTRFRKRRPEEKPENDEICISVEPFKEMTNLSLLQINHVKLEGKLKLLPPELKWLQWKGCPLEKLPSDFHGGQLSVLDLSESRIRQVCGLSSKGVAESLKVVNLRGCHSLEMVPDLSKQKALEKLVLERCNRLVKIHKSVGNLRTLLHLNLGNCPNLSEFVTDVSGLKHLENLILSGCSKLRELPENLGDMQCLKELLVDETAITKLPESIFRLESLEMLSLKGCRSIKGLPVCIGTLISLKELNLNDTALQDLPSSIGHLKNLQRLSLMRCASLHMIPDTIGELISLKELFINGSGVKVLPFCLGSLPCLADLSAGECKLLKQLPGSIGGLNSLSQLQLDRTPIENLPEEICDLPFIRRLELRNCEFLSFLPESFGNMDTLHGLYLEGSNIEELPESIGKLENLVILRMNKCRRLRKLPESFGDLKSLHHLHMQETPVIELPESFGKLSNLMVLKMLKKPLFRSLSNNVSEAASPGREPRFVKLPNSFSNLSLLEDLDARSCRISGNLPDEFEKLSSLKSLDLRNNYIHSLPSSLKGLSNLRELLLYDCQELRSLPCLPSSLEKLDLTNCFSLERIDDISNLELLHYLSLTNCQRVVDIPGLERLKALKRLYLAGCNACSIAIKRRLSKVYLRNLRNLSMPGSRIPDWFSQDTVTFSAHPNRELRGVILAVVVALNHGSSDDYQLPSVVGIQAQVLKLDLPLYTHTLQLFGVPRTNRDQLHICRYPAFHPMVASLKDGYKIRVIKKDMPFKLGVELKMHGIHLVYEDDDDYKGDEHLLNETQQTVSQKLANFYRSFEEGEDSESTPT